QGFSSVWDVRRTWNVYTLRKHKIFDTFRRDSVHVGASMEAPLNGSPWRGTLIGVPLVVRTRVREQLESLRQSLVVCVTNAVSAILEPKVLAQGGIVSDDSQTEFPSVLLPVRWCFSTASNARLSG
ncbi:MAG: hypothetical protein ACODAD_11485, partial [Planctomycetota bacterium]